MSKNKKTVAARKGKTRAAAANVEELRPVAVETPAVVPVATTSAKESIRGVLRAGLIAGSSTKELEAVLKAKFPTSKAAEKASIHIGFYRSELRKEGLLPKA